jgi:hypothetical protein
MKIFKNNAIYLNFYFKSLFKKIKLTHVFNHFSVPNVSSRKIDKA